MKNDPSSTTTIVIMAALSVLVLLLISDLSPTLVNGFNDLPEDGKPFEVMCTIVSEREAKDGKILELRDPEGTVIKAYCPSDIWKEVQLPLVACITGRLDDGQELFMFIDTIEPHSG